jgi:hypothetical protein
VMLDAIDHATTTISLETYTGRARSARSSQMPSPCARVTGTTPSEPSTIGKGIAPRAPSFSGSTSRLWRARRYHLLDGRTGLAR